MALPLDDYSLVARLLRREYWNKATDHHVLWEVTWNLSPPSSLSFSSAPPLTMKGVLKYLPGVAWKRLGSELIPSEVFHEIAQHTVKNFGLL